MHTELKIKFVNSKVNLLDAIAIGVNDNLDYCSSIKQNHPELYKLLQKFLKNSHFKGKKHEHILMIWPVADKLKSVLLIGMGAPKDQTHTALLSIGGACYSHLHANKEAASATLFMGATDHVAVSAILAGFSLRSYKFDKYYSKETKAPKHVLTNLEVLVDDPKSAQESFAQEKKLVDAIFFSRDLVSEPSNILYPETMAERCQELAELGVEVEVFNELDLKKLHMGALLGVGQGSTKESQMVVMHWNGLPKSRKDKPIAFIGKGVTFDTGGISLKGSHGMESMKYDMAGAAAVIGLIKGLAGRRAAVNVVGIVGLVENMPDGNAIKPGDVLTSMSGQTIAVLNTDAEGRLVLADCLWYCQDRFKPKFMINLATLTGAIIQTFGHHYAGLFSNNDELANNLLQASETTGERLFRLPLNDIYHKYLDSEIADLQNVTNEKGAGSILAAQFLERFVNKCHWAHLDIAGMAWANKDEDITPKGATAFGVRLLNQLVTDHYEG